MYKNIVRIALLSTSILVITPLQSTAQNIEKNDLLSFSFGYSDAFSNDEALDFRVEYRPDHTYFWNIKPWAGLEVTSDFSPWGGGGFLLDYEVSPNWYITPSVGAGLYFQGSSDLDLDYPIQFRSQLETSYKLETGSRIGLALSHTSNADLGNDNPGTESLNVYWHVPY